MADKMQIGGFLFPFKIHLDLAIYTPLIPFAKIA